MKRDEELIRKILLAIEERDEFDGSSTEYFDPKWIETSLSKLRYNALILHDSGLINRIELIESNEVDQDSTYIDRLTKDGHDFLDLIRDDEAWNIVKSEAKKVGSFSIETLREIGKAYLKKQFKEKIGLELDI